MKGFVGNLAFLLLAGSLLVEGRTTQKPPDRQYTDCDDQGVCSEISEWDYYSSSSSSSDGDNISITNTNINNEENRSSNTYNSQVHHHYYDSNGILRDDRDNDRDRDGKKGRRNDDRDWDDKKGRRGKDFDLEAANRKFLREGGLVGNIAQAPGNIIKFLVGEDPKRGRENQRRGREDGGLIKGILEAPGKILEGTAKALFGGGKNGKRDWDDKNGRRDWEDKNDKRRPSFDRNDGRRGGAGLGLEANLDIGAGLGGKSNGRGGAGIGLGANVGLNGGVGANDRKNIVGYY